MSTEGKTRVTFNQETEKIISEIDNMEIQTRVRECYFLIAQIKDSPLSSQSTLKLTVERSKHHSGETQWTATISNVTQNITMQEVGNIKRDTKSYCEFYNPDKRLFVFVFLLQRPLKRAKRDKVEFLMDEDFVLCGTSIPITYDQALLDELSESDSKHVESASDLLVGKYFMSGKDLKGVVMQIARNREGKTLFIDIQYRNVASTLDLTRIANDSSGLSDMTLMPSERGIGLRLFVHDPSHFGNEDSKVGSKRKLGAASDLHPPLKRSII